MQNHRIVLFISVVEILIGGVTLFGNFLSVLLEANTKSPNVFAFVTMASCISLLLGVGLLKRDKRAYQLLLYFSSVIILSKILISLNIIRLNGELEVSVHQALNIPLSEGWRSVMNAIKNCISIIYHGLVIWGLNIGGVKKNFYG